MDIVNTIMGGPSPLPNIGSSATDYSKSSTKPKIDENIKMLMKVKLAKGFLADYDKYYNKYNDNYNKIKSSLYNQDETSSSSLKSSNSSIALHRAIALPGDSAF